MTTNPYVRNLIATQRNVVDARAEVEYWVDRLEDLLIEQDREGVSAWAFDVLALWGRLQRTRPELIEQVGGAPVLERVNALLDKEGATLAGEALKLPDMAGWQADLEAILRLVDADEDDDETAEAIGELLLDLDAADLVAMMASRLGNSDEELLADIADCERLLLSRAEVFLPASVRVQAIGQSLRPDLPDADPQLAVTAEKYVHLLDAFEAIERDVTFEDVAPLRVDRAQSAVTYRIADHLKLIASNWECTPALAASQQDNRQPYGLTWKSPDGKLRAQLLVFLPVADEQTEIVVEFLSESDMRPATWLSGEPVWLAGVQCRIDADGNAKFRWRDLPRDGVLSPLEVGSDRVAWVLDEGGSGG